MRIAATEHDIKSCCQPRHLLAFRGFQRESRMPEEISIPSFIESPFATHKEYDAFLRLAPEERKAALRAARVNEAPSAAVADEPQSALPSSNLPPILPFIETPFPTRRAYEEHLVAEAAAAANPKDPNAELVGHTVELMGLKGRAELNGRKGRVVSWNPTTGRCGVLIKTVQQFGAVERTTLALLPTNLKVTDSTDAPEIRDELASWPVLLDHINLPHLKKIHWSLHEEKLFDALMATPPQRDTALEEMAKAGVSSALEREQLLAALHGPPTMFGKCGLKSVLMKLLAARVTRMDQRDKKQYEAKKAELDKESAGVPRADAKYPVSTGRVCVQLHGSLDGDVCKPPLKSARNSKFSATVYPSPSQADHIAGLLRTRVRNTVCIGSGERVFEGMLERRGVPLLAIDSDTFDDGGVYYDKRIYCKEVRRVGISSIMLLQEPASTALVFVNGFLTPWEAYLSKYPELPLVLIIGDDDTDQKGHYPRPNALEQHVGFRLLRRMPIDVFERPPLTLAVYERV